MTPDRPIDDATQGLSQRQPASSKRRVRGFSVALEDACRNREVAVKLALLHAGPGTVAGQRERHVVGIGEMQFVGENSRLIEDGETPAEAALRE